MKKILPSYLRGLLLAGVLSLMSISSYASHIVGAELTYKWISGQTYQITMFLYGDCGSTTGAFQTLPIATPQIAIYDGATNVACIHLGLPVPVCGAEITPVCPDSLAFTNCTSLSYATPGVKKFIYTGTYIVPHASANWRFIYTSENGTAFGTWSCTGTSGTGSGGPSAAGRSAVITNLTSPGSTVMQLIDTLNNSVTNSRGHNSSPILTVEPTPYFCQGYLDCYNPGAVDIYDTAYLSEPAGDSLVFQLIAATNGAGGCPGAPGGAIGYSGLQYPGGPLNTGDHPLYCIDGSPSSFVFDPQTGQLCFKPLAQRSTVVYNIQEYRNDTVLGVISHIKVGTMQREMTFLVKPCTYTTPEGKIDSAAGGTMVDSTHYYSCANSGIMILSTHPSDGDPTLNITVTATGLSPGFVLTVTGNGTPTPVATVTINTGTVTPGNYTFYLTYTDNHCPLTGTLTQAFKVDILPVPTVRDSLIKNATCTDSAVFMIIPGGTGKPWTIKISDNIGDTIQIFSADSLSFRDSLPPGVYTMTIFTAASNECHVNQPLIIDTPSFTMTGTFVDPTYCGASDGRVILHGLNPGKMDTVRWHYQGIPQPRQGFIVTGGGTDTMTGLLAGLYDNIIAYEGLCKTDPPLAITLTNPPFIYRTVTSVNPSKCGFCDGIIKLWGIHPGQLDTISYTFNGTTTTSISNFIAADSTVTISGMCAGSYTNFTVKTAGICSYNIPGPIVLAAPPIVPLFDTIVHYGCHGDTLELINQSTPVSDLTYQWFFGDGSTSTAISPTHVYTNTTANTVTIKLIITNTKCVDSFKITKTFDNNIHAGFTFVPDPFVCQNSPVTFTNTSIGTNPTYTWYFGDGTTDNSVSPVHSFVNSGQYRIKLVANENILPTPIPPNTYVPCFDTMTQSLAVDSISAVSLLATDTVICRGQAITFKGIYSTLGDTGLIWSFGDGNTTFNINPIIHAFDIADSSLIVQVTVKYRACPETSAIRQIRVYGYPSIYLGPDTTICPGGNAITLVDDRNVTSAKKAHWLWNTGDTSNAIIVTQPGVYSTIVTIDGCSSADTVSVQKDCYMNIPNVFTPNGDGVNDYFFPRQLLTRGVTKFSMNVYNRWGQSVYETTNIDGRGWDGSFNNKPQPEGVYVYLIEASFKDGQIEHHQGNVTLIR